MWLDPQHHHLSPAVRLAKGDLDVAIRESVRLQALALREGSTVIKRLVREKALLVVGGVYNLATGQVNLVELAP